MKLKIAIQKSGRLYEDSVKLLNQCGIDLRNVKDRLRTESDSFPLEVFFLRDDDIPQYVEDGVADVGIVGENVLYEKNKQVDVVEQLGFGKCRLSIAIPRSQQYEGIKSLQGKRIATSYPFLVQQYLKEKNVTADIHEISGSVEIAPGIGLADVVADLVSSGSTLLINGLKEVEVILPSEAVLIKYKSLEQEQLDLLNKFVFRIKSIQKAKGQRYISLNAPDEALQDIISLIPGFKGPTVIPLSEKGWSSVRSIVAVSDLWETVEKLQQRGADDILIIPIEKIIN
jgi:ATP phosphoribosyltransferase